MRSLVLILAVPLAGCGDVTATGAGAARNAAPAPQAALPPGDTQLTASVVEGGGRDVRLGWATEAPDAADRAWFVEFSLNDEPDFSVLTIVPPRTRSFVHPAVARDTRFNYRVRPAIGAASAVVHIATSQPTPASPAIEREGPLDDGAAPARGAIVASLRDSATRADAAPDGLRVSATSPTSVALRWRDRAGDEDGYLVEVSASPESGYLVCALLPAGATSFHKASLPPLTTCFFRVRAFAHGPPSNVATAMVASR